MRLVPLVLLVGCVSACDRVPTPAPPKLGMPADEAAFIAAKDQAEASYDQAPNDIAKSQIAALWEKDVCRAIASPHISNWSGTVSGIVSAPDGIIVALADGVRVEADVPAGPLLVRVASLREGQAVVFTGSFKAGEDGHRP